MRQIKKILCSVCVFCVICLLCACESRESSEIKMVALNEKQQILADSIWQNRSLWRGCAQLSLHKVGRGNGNEYYLVANFFVSQSNIGNVFGSGSVKVGTYKKYTYRIVDGKVVDNMSLGEDGILAASQQLGQISFAKTDTDEVIRNKISHLAVKY